MENNLHDKDLDYLYAVPSDVELINYISQLREYIKTLENANIIKTEAIKAEIASIKLLLNR